MVKKPKRQNKNKSKKENQYIEKRTQLKNQRILFVTLVVSIVILVSTIVILYSYFQDRYSVLNALHQDLQDDYNNLQTLYSDLNNTYHDTKNRYVNLLSKFDSFIEYGNITVYEAKILFDAKSDLIIVDARYSQNYTEGHIERAINICIICHPSEYLELDRNSEILIYSQTGVRSTRAMHWLHNNGYKKVYNMIGGIEAWQSEGYTIIEE